MTDEREKLLEELAPALFKAVSSETSGRSIQNCGWSLLPGHLKNRYRRLAEAALAAIEQAGGYAPEGTWLAPDDLKLSNEVLESGARELAEYEVFLQPEKNEPAAFACFDAMWRAMRNAAKEG